MPQAPGPARFDLIASKWHALAQRRLLYYSELYRSGRWTHYYASRAQFARHQFHRRDIAAVARDQNELA